jgi:hypothetical protein
MNDRTTATACATPRKLILFGSKRFSVHQHIILKNYWEYYLGKVDKYGVAYGFVMGLENEWGSVSMAEIKPYIMSIARGKELNQVMPPTGYSWEASDE